MEIEDRDIKRQLMTRLNLERPTNCKRRERARQVLHTSPSHLYRRFTSHNHHEMPMPTWPACLGPAKKLPAVTSNLRSGVDAIYALQLDLLG